MYFLHTYMKHWCQFILITIDNVVPMLQICLKTEALEICSSPRPEISFSGTPTWIVYLPHAESVGLPTGVTLHSRQLV
jgi:hypothetical protein